MSIYESQRKWNQQEQRKKPGQEFCDKVGWKLLDKYELLQRPDKVTMVGGTIYRTITPTTHVWYKNKVNNKHIWIEFDAVGAIMIKRDINVEINTHGNQILSIPHPDMFREFKVFYDANDAYDFLISID